jgi:hypothetical protein
MVPLQVGPLVAVDLDRQIGSLDTACGRDSGAPFISRDAEAGLGLGSLDRLAPYFTAKNATQNQCAG